MGCQGPRIASRDRSKRFFHGHHDHESYLPPHIFAGEQLLGAASTTLACHAGGATAPSPTATIRATASLWPSEPSARIMTRGERRAEALGFDETVPIANRRGCSEYVVIASLQLR